MLDRLQDPRLHRPPDAAAGTGAPPLAAPPADATDASMDEHARAQRFRDTALPHLDDAFTLARYLLRNASDAEDAVQECYLRAWRHFDSYRGPAFKPWLLAILRNVCLAELARRSRLETAGAPHEADAAAEAAPLWQEAEATPETALLRQHDDDTLRRMIAELPQPFREVIVLREINELSYQQIAELAAVPLGTVMSRLARARSMLRKAWNAPEGHEP